MPGENNIYIFITFFLAMVGYAGLTITILIEAVKKKIPTHFWRIIVLIILAHVLMVWSYRYNWNFSLSVRNGYSGFIIFHSALLMILSSVIVRERISKNLIRISFVVVTAGAVGASFRYEIVEIYRIPVIVCEGLGILSLLWNYYQRYLIKKKKM